MLYHFLILSGEREDFVREILINSDATFLDLHEAIQESVGYDTSQIASFFVSDDEWDKGQEITLIKMDRRSGDEELIMQDVKLQDILMNKKDRLIYQFDFFSNRGFFIELLSISENRTIAQPALIKSEGEPPEQILLDDIGLDEVSSLLGLTEEDDEFDDEFNDIRFEDLDSDSYEEYF
ncbi:hypothetical protein ACE01N_05475 [Saccharicrinis sp. FJH2]|uniref:IS1096 element passenger TnpR family protein n=1 Tax=unclassified Saccharicrinis TaxID=2646859 RepID=UPI0035D401D9